jgi:hypothetical protein
VEAVMKKFLVLVFCISLSIGSISTANAAAKKFKNCTELNKVYPGGVAKPGAVNKGGATKKNPLLMQLYIRPTVNLIEIKME